LPLGQHGGAGDAQLVLRLKRDDAPEPVEVSLTVDGQPVPALRVDGSWVEHRVALPRAAASHRVLRVSTDDRSAILVIDHALLFSPSRASEAKAAGDAQHVN
jgi:hypothetical protein